MYVFLLLVAYSACRENRGTLRTCHVHSVLRIHAWHYVCARRRRAVDVLSMYPSCSLWVDQHVARARTMRRRYTNASHIKLMAGIVVCHPECRFCVLWEYGLDDVKLRKFLCDYAIITVIRRRRVEESRDRKDVLKLTSFAVSFSFLWAHLR